MALGKPKHKSKSFVDEDVWTLALQRTRDIYDEYDRVVVSFSGGKDSTAVLHVALEIAHERNRLPLEVVFWDEEAIPLPTIDYVHRVAARDDVKMLWYCLPVQHLNACSPKNPYWWPWDPDCPELWVRPLPDCAITEHPGFKTQPPSARPAIPEFALRAFDDPSVATALLLGMRAQESLRRTSIVTRRTYKNYISVIRKPGMRSRIAKANPIYDWKTEDVWHGPQHLGWDYNLTYDHMKALGVSPKDQRVAPPFGAEPLQRLWTYAQCWPELWDAMTRRVPGAATAGRYACSPLYAKSYSRIDVRPDDDHLQMIRSMILRWAVPEQKVIRRRIKTEIARHRKMTDVPIPLEGGMSGCSWRYLYFIASRGDFKNRCRPHQYADYPE